MSSNLHYLKSVEIATGRENVANAKCSIVTVDGKTRIVAELLGNQKMIPYGEFSAYRKGFGSDVYQIDSISGALSLVPFKQEILNGNQCWVAQEDIYRDVIARGVANGGIPQERLPEVVNDIIYSLWYNLSQSHLKTPFIVRVRDTITKKVDAKFCTTLEEAKSIFNSLAVKEDSIYQDIAILKYDTKTASYYLALL